MSSDAYGVDEATRALLLLMPRLVGRAKRVPPPEPLRSFQLAPRHLSLLAYLVFDGPLGVKDLAARLEVAPASVRLRVADLSRQGVLERREDEADRRRTIVNIAAEHARAVTDWLAAGGRAWQVALEPLTPEQRRLVVETLQAYEREVSGPEQKAQE